MAALGEARFALPITIGPFTSVSGLINAVKIPGAAQVQRVSAVNDADVATGTNTMQVELVKTGTTGAVAPVQIANFPAADGWTAHTGRAGTLATAVADRKVASGEWVGVRITLAGTGVATLLFVSVDLVAGHQS